MQKSTHSPAYRRLLVALKQARQEAGLNQVQVARKLRKPQSFVSKIESGERRVDVVELAELCRAYGADLITFVRELHL